MHMKAPLHHRLKESTPHRGASILTSKINSQLVPAIYQRSSTSLRIANRDFLLRPHAPLQDVQTTSLLISQRRVSKGNKLGF